MMGEGVFNQVKQMLATFKADYKEGLRENLRELKELIRQK